MQTRIQQFSKLRNLFIKPMTTQQYTLCVNCAMCMYLNANFTLKFENFRYDRMMKVYFFFAYEAATTYIA